MKKQYYLLGLFAVLASLTSCNKNECVNTVEFMVYEPEYITTAELREEITFQASREMKNPGKLYIYQDYLMINEQARGIHVFDNSNPENPINLGFIAIPGNVDMGVRNGVLFADSYFDLVAVRLNDLDDLEELAREIDVFPGSNWATGLQTSENGILVGYNLTEVREDLSCVQPVPSAINYRNVNGDLIPGEPPVNSTTQIDWDVVDGGFGGAEGVPTGGANGGGNSVGIAGSTARFAIMDQVLYSVSNTQMRYFDISNPEDLDQTGEIWVNWGTETLFPYGDLLFVGGQQGMTIYEKQDSEGNLEWVSQFNHATSCDPVVVEGNYAYVTLRSGTFCQGFSNQLDVIDISNIYEPTLLETYPMHNPNGLGIDDDVLFICDGDEGLKVFDATDKEAIDDNLIKQYGDIRVTDVIPYNDVLIAVGEDGFYQYDYSDETNIQLLSKILVD